MGDWTTMTIRRETKERLDEEHREEGESWDTLQQRFMDGTASKTDLDYVLEAIETLPEQTADKLEERLR